MKLLFLVFFSFPLFAKDIVITKKEKYILNHHLHKPIVGTDSSCFSIQTFPRRTVIQGKKYFKSCALKVGSHIYTFHFLPKKVIHFYEKLKSIESYIFPTQISIQQGKIHLSGPSLTPSNHLYVKSLYDSFHFDYSFPIYSIKTPLSKDIWLKLKNEGNKKFPEIYFKRKGNYEIELSTSSKSKKLSFSKHLFSYGLTPQWLNSNKIQETLKISFLFYQTNENHNQQFGLQQKEHFLLETLPQAHFSSEQSFSPYLSKNQGRENLLGKKIFYVKANDTVDFHLGGEIPLRYKDENSFKISWKSYGLFISCQTKSQDKNLTEVKVNFTSSYPDYSVTVDGLPGLKKSHLKTNLNFKKDMWIPLGDLFILEKGTHKQSQTLLSSLPIIGSAFKDNSKINHKRNLFVKVKIESLKD